MKKYILSTLASALIVPGLGQIINRQVIKGLIIMSGVFILLLVCMYKLVLITMDLVKNLDPEEINFNTLLAKVHEQDLGALEIFIIAFIVVWIFAIIDAFMVGLRLEKMESGESK
jgi:TM2 domain-containing membrane protein YozV